MYVYVYLDCAIIRCEVKLQFVDKKFLIINYLCTYISGLVGLLDGDDIYMYRHIYICIYMHVCLFIYVYICIYMYIYIYIYIYIHTNNYLYIYIHTHNIHIYIHSHLYIHISLIWNITHYHSQKITSSYVLNQQCWFSGKSN
jgi:hypothetical protein